MWFTAVSILIDLLYVQSLAWIWDRETWPEEIKSHYLRFNVSIKLLAGEPQQPKSKFIYFLYNWNAHIFNTINLEQITLPFNVVKSYNLSFLNATSDFVTLQSI